MMLQGSSLTSRIGGLIDALTYMRRERGVPRQGCTMAQLRQHTACDFHPFALSKFVSLYLTFVVGLCHNPRFMFNHEHVLCTTLTSSTSSKGKAPHNSCSHRS